jgi:hypothetical protein
VIESAAGFGIGAQSGLSFAGSRTAERSVRPIAQSLSQT